MTGKLLKYDLLQSGGKYLMALAIMAGLLASAALLSLFNIAFIDNVLFVICILAAIGLLFMYVIFSVMDFYKSMSGNGSYFTYMLPVGINKILISKLITVLLYGLGVALTELLFWMALDKVLLGRLGLSLSSLYDMMAGNSEIVLYTSAMLLLQYLGMVALVAFCISLTSVPLFRNSGAGIPAGVVAYMVLNNAVGLVQVGIVFAAAFFRGKMDIVFGDNVALEQIPDFLRDMSFALLISYAVIVPLFWYLTSLMYKKHRTI